MITFPKLENGFFLPSQPEFELYTEYYMEHKQKNLENQSAILFYQFKMKEAYNQISVIPDGCVDILISCSEQVPSAYICGSITKSKSINLPANNVYFGVRFLYCQGTQKTQYTLKEIIDKEVPLIEMVSMDNTVIEKIIEKKNFMERINTFNETIGKFLFRADTCSKLIKNALHTLYSTKGNISMTQLANEIGCSTRYLRKQFEDHIGISPKLFSQIVRFQSSLNMLLKHNHCSIVDVIYENGYYDQAHLINEFRNFGYGTPSKLATQ